jgi:hypothetical protein
MTTTDMYKSFYIADVKATAEYQGIIYEQTCTVSTNVDNNSKFFVYDDNLLVKKEDIGHVLSIEIEILVKSINKDVKSELAESKHNNHYLCCKKVSATQVEHGDRKFYVHSVLFDEYEVGEFLWIDFIMMKLRSVER